jgi:hypothetical protein
MWWWYEIREATVSVLGHVGVWCEVPKLLPGAV